MLYESTGERAVSNMDLTEKEQHLIEEIRQIPFGEVVIFLQDNQPVRIEKGIESKKL